MMKNVYEVLRQKEQLLAQTQREVEALRLVAPMLADQAEAQAAGADGGNQPQALKDAMKRWP